jgi:hypothetical protein
MSRIAESKLMTIIIDILLTAAVIYFGFVMYWVLEDDTVLEEQDGNYTLEEYEYKPGDVLNIINTSCGISSTLICAFSCSIGIFILKIYYKSFSTQIIFS